jgi:ribosomal protein S18 acetylase RimI-like enzyme
MELVTTSALPLPAPKVDISIRPATVDDIPAIDRLQKPHSRELGFFPRGQLEGYIEKRGVLVAERAGTRDEGQGTSRTHGSPNASSLVPSPSTLLGYVAYSDRYLKRDELGIIVQLCVDPAMRRSFIGAALLKAAFERSPYGCRLYCCWCAQDIAANRFWESMGFSAIAFRTGSVKTKGLRDCGTTGLREEDKGAFPSVPYPSVPQSRSRGPRIHIFWQKRIRAGDTATPFWFPSKTDGGAMGAQRLVLPIPPGVRWSDVMPVILPTAGVLPEGVASCQLSVASEERKALPSARSANRKSEMENRRLVALPESRPKLGGIFFKPSKPVRKPGEKEPREKKPKAKFDQAVIAQARELRDRWMERQDDFVALPGGKYDVARDVQASPHAIHAGMVEPTKRIAA